MMRMMMMNCFCGMVDQQTCLDLFSAGTIVRDPHHRVSLTRHEHYLFAQNLSSGFVEWSCAVVTNTTPRRVGKDLFEDLPVADSAQLMEEYESSYDT